MAEFAHHCSACGEMHGGPGGETEAVKIAKIEADRDIQVARIQRSEARQEIEADVEIAGIGAEAAVDAAVAEAAVLEEVLSPPEPVTEPEPEPEPEPEVIPEPEPAGEEVLSPPEHEVKAPKAGKGFWAGYSAS